MKLTVIRGVPGSGKSTYAKKNFSCLILEQDMFHMHDGEYCWKADAMQNAVKWCQTTAYNALQFGMDVCVVNTFVKKKYIDTYRQMAEELGATFEVIRMTSSYDNVHNVPENVLDNMSKSFEDWPNEQFVG